MKIDLVQSKVQKKIKILIQRISSNNFFYHHLRLFLRPLKCDQHLFQLGDQRNM